MGPRSQAAVADFQREIIGALRSVREELLALRQTINRNLGSNALDHETIETRLDQAEGRLYRLEHPTAGPVGPNGSAA